MNRLEEIKALRALEKVHVQGMNPTPLVSGKDIDWLIDRIDFLSVWNKAQESKLNEFGMEIGNLEGIYQDQKEILLKMYDENYRLTEKIADLLDALNKIAHPYREDVSKEWFEFCEANNRQVSFQVFLIKKAKDALEEED